MDDEGKRSDGDETAVGFDDGPEFDELEDRESDIEIQLLFQRVRAARFAGA
jgi:hypothetical protein